MAEYFIGMHCKFDYRNFIKEMAKYTYLLHISNIKITDTIKKWTSSSISRIGHRRRVE